MNHPRTVQRIGFDAKRIFNNRTGLGNYSRFVVNALLKYYPDKELYLFTPTISETWNDLYKDSKQVHIITPQTIIGKSFKSAWRTFSLAAEMARFNLDVFHGLSNELPSGMDDFKGKKIVTIHDLIFLRYPNYYSNIDRFIYTRKFRNSCQAADLVIATSEQTKSDLIQLLHIDASKIEVVYQNCDASFAHIASQETKLEVRQKWQLPDTYILCVGTIEQRKNQLTVLKAFHQTAPLNTKLVFVGRKTKYAAELTEYIAEHHLEQEVIFLENIDWKDLPVVFQMASLFIYASEFEGFGIPVIEAYRSGVPAVLAKSSSLLELGNEQSLWFDPHDVNMLANHIHLLLNNKNLSEQLIQNGNQLQQRFETAQLIRQMMDLYSA